MIAPTLSEVIHGLDAKAWSMFRDEPTQQRRDLSKIYAAETLLNEATSLIAELLTKPHDEILDHSAREFLAQFTSTEPAMPCSPSSSSSSSSASSPAPAAES